MVVSNRAFQWLAAAGVTAALIFSIAPATSMAPSEQTSDTSDMSASAAHMTAWSGYAATGKIFTEVQGAIKVPKATCTQDVAQALFWVGLDGYQSATVEQAGIGVKCHGANLRTPSYFAWWEMYPTNNVQTMPLKVVPGDLVASTVSYAGSKFSMRVSNNTRHTSYTATAKCGSGQTCSRNSAEWIVERPLINKGYKPLAKWGTATLYNNTAANGGNLKSISAFTHNAVDMYTAKNKLLARAGGLSANGKSFTDTWVAAN